MIVIAAEGECALKAIAEQEEVVGQSGSETVHIAVELRTETIGRVH